LLAFPTIFFSFPSKWTGSFRYVVTYLVEVDGGLPELLLGLVEVTHTDLTEVTRVVLVDVGTVVVLTTGHTTTTGGLAVLANTTVTGGHVAAAVEEKEEVSILFFRRYNG
jgi:hypothetical protein